MTARVARSQGPIACQLALDRYSAVAAAASPSLHGVTADEQPHKLCIAKRTYYNADNQPTAMPVVIAEALQLWY